MARRQAAVCPSTKRHLTYERRSEKLEAFGLQPLQDRGFEEAARKDDMAAADEVDLQPLGLGRAGLKERCFYVSDEILHIRTKGAMFSDAARAMREPGTRSAH